MPEERVELHQAFMWDCPACGRENFERAVVSEAPQEEQIAEALASGAVTEEDLAEGLEGQWVFAPDRVTCKHADCGKEFDAFDQIDGEDDDASDDCTPDGHGDAL